jgi:CrcB protein
MQTLWIALGGAFGTAARYQLSLWAERRFGAGQTHGTLLVNLLGSFLLAALMCASLRSQLVPPSARLVLGAGVLGGFTTYSAFSYESLRALQQGAWGAAALNIAMTVLGCLLAAALGWALASQVLR